MLGVHDSRRLGDWEWVPVAYFWSVTVVGLVLAMSNEVSLTSGYVRTLAIPSQQQGASTDCSAAKEGTGAELRVRSTVGCKVAHAAEAVSKGLFVHSP